MLFLNGGVPVIINRNQENMIEGTIEELEALIKEKCEYKPYKVYEKELSKKLDDPITYIESGIEENLDEIIEKLNEVEPVVVEAQAEEAVGEVLEAEALEETTSQEASDTQESDKEE